MSDQPREGRGEGDGRFRAKSSPDSELKLPKTDQTAQILRDIANLNGDAQLIVERGRAHFLGATGTLERHAADGIIVKVHELCERLPQEFRDARPDVPWSEIRGTRDRMGHNYRDSDYRIIWNTLTDGLPALAVQLKFTETTPDQRS